MTKTIVFDGHHLLLSFVRPCSHLTSAFSFFFDLSFVAIGSILKFSDVNSDAKCEQGFTSIALVYALIQREWTFSCLTLGNLKTQNGTVHCSQIDKNVSLHTRESQGKKVFVVANVPQ